MEMMISYNTKAFCRHDFELMCKTLNIVGLSCLELHLGHFIDQTEFLDALYIRSILDKYKLTISIVDGGWCDLASDQIEKIPIQMQLAKDLGATGIRLFFTPYSFEEIGEGGIEKIHFHIGMISSAWPNINILFETHQGIGVESEHVAALMTAAPSNVGIVFDPVNIALTGEDPRDSLEVLRPFIKHVHLKGALKQPNGTVNYCEFGEGNIFIDDLIFPLSEITNSFGIEYEGEGCPILGMLKSKENLEMLEVLHD